MKTVIVGMSGGVDSSVAAIRLLEQGHQVSGLFMKNWEEDDTAEYCSATKDLADATAVCHVLGIPLHTVNFSHEYWNNVFAHFLEEYRTGRTPNPDVVCNREIKFKEFLRWAIHLGADGIATGHYARLVPDQQQIRLLKGSDANKDQSYFLHTLDQEALRQAHFPLGEMQKSEVRVIARDWGLPVHDKKDSTGICFIGERRFRDFLGRFLPARKGDIQTLDGEVLGEHLGSYYYTIGQRQGLGIGGEGEPWYVADKDIQKNIVYVIQGHNHPALYHRIILAENLHWISGVPPNPLGLCRAKIRYRQEEQPCRINLIGPNLARIVFQDSQWAVTPGQSIVFYQGDTCLGGGVIRSAGK